ncbi:MAG: acetyl-CoA carboxylase biotin carboxylase subunit [Candidatus Sumerlaeales bacterium]|nr:acetyl-CoA carboxylase biotin carboxylase subunit [Candidatus Sumerlaeales bacterium]
MIRKVLIANRGEVALRIIRACKEQGIRTVAVYSEADEDSVPVKFADEHVCIGPAPASQSYLNIQQIISAAEITDSDAIHPGYGFLAENAGFAELCAKCNIKFIGPDANAIRHMGDKATAKQTMRAAGVPCIPGSDGVCETLADAATVADECGYPVIVKASAGGGGKGMRLAQDRAELESAYNMARMEAQKAFGDGSVYVEKYVLNPKHVEVQIIADQFGNVVALGERDCSLQRRHQKLLEESPCVVLDEETRQKMYAAAIKAAKAVNYTSVGTVEFLYSSQTKEFYFMEMNTRIQVEHPVTEEVTGIDLMSEMLHVASGLALPFRQEDITQSGHAIECRINAEDPERGFCPSPGKITTYYMPGGIGVRVDSHCYQGYVIPPYYDSMIAKLIIHAPTRKECVRRALRALDEFYIEGIATTLPFYRNVLMSKPFLRGTFGTGFLEEFLVD